MNLVWLSAHLFVLALVAEPAAAPVAAPIADSPDAPDLPEVAPAEVVRIKRDFGKPNFDLVIDAWADVAAGRLREVRLWWTNTDEVDHRKPLGRMIERMVKLQYRRITDTSLTVAVAGDGKRFTFTVELDKAGKVAVFVPIETADGRTIRRCRTDSARLLARRVLGMPVGISHIAVTCRDGKGALQAGKLRYREV